MSTACKKTQRGVLFFCLWRATNSMRVLSRTLANNTAQNGGFPVVGEWQSVPETSQVVYQEIGRCYDPDRDWSRLPASHEEVAWEADFNAAVKDALNFGSNMPTPQLLWRPLTSAVDKVGALAWYLPWHTAVAITNRPRTQVEEDQSWADSHCFHFDYSKVGAADPHGCGFFRKSFQPLQELRQCVLEKMGNSPRWNVYQRMSKRVVMERERGVRNVVNPLEVYEEDGHQLAQDAGIVKFTFDGIRRVDEMIKYISFKNWEILGEGLIDELEKKISETIITRDKSPVLEEDVVASIRKDCFRVDTDSWTELPVIAKRLKRVMPCYQLMWDQIEVSGGREKPLSNAVTMWDPSLRYPSVVKDDFDATPPVCARAAVALIAESTKRAPGRFSKTACLYKGEKSWEKCLHPQHFNCICFTHCFKTALRKMCELNSGCCPSSEEAWTSLTADD